MSCHLNHQKQTVPHQWLCGGKLLLLDDPKHENNIKLFQNQWIRGQPVLACKSAELLDKKLWHPEAFLKDFGHLKHDLVNCLTGKTVPKASLHTFWKGKFHDPVFEFCREINQFHKKFIYIYSLSHSCMIILILSRSIDDQK